MTGKPRRRPRTVRTRLAIVVMVSGLSAALLGAGEVAARLLVPPPTDDPYLQISSPVSIYGEVEVDGERYYRITHPEAYRAKNTVFPVRKPAGAFRVFCLGGSASAGWPHPPDESYGDYLRGALAAAHPDRQIEVLNASAHAFPSYRVRLIFDEVIEFDPDLLIVYSGNNEFVERRSYFVGSAASRTVDAIAKHSRLLQVLADWFGGAEAPRPSLSGEGLTDSAFHVWSHIAQVALELRTDPEQFERVVDHYGFSIDYMVRTGLERGVPVLVLTVPSNLRDWQPHVASNDLTGSALEEWNASYRQGRRKLLEGDYEAAANLLQRVADLEPTHSRARFHLAQALERLERHAEAAAHYRLAKDHDHNPFRAPSELNEALRAIASRYDDAHLVDLEAAFAAAAAPRVPGFDLFLDYVHPSKAGNLLIARVAFEAITEGQILGPTGGGDFVHEDSGYRDEKDLKMHLALLGLFSFMHQYESYLFLAERTIQLMDEQGGPLSTEVWRERIAYWVNGYTAYLEASRNELLGLPYDADYLSKHDALYRGSREKKAAEAGK